MARIGVLEAGGTKMVCAVAQDGVLCERVQIPTADPQQTLPALTEYFAARQVQALGVGCFGPLDLVPGSPTYGYITATPKVAWRECDIVGALGGALGVPVALDTDVNCAVLGEAQFGSCRGLADCVYITVGTGIGMGVLCGGRLVHGIQHPELGHMPVQPQPGDAFAGCCPYHGRCLEGMASGSAVRARWGRPGQQLAQCEEVWQLEAEYLAQGVMVCVLAYAPQRIVLGGGVMQQPGLLELVRRKTAERLAEYVPAPAVQDMQSYLVAPALAGDQALLGCMALAQQQFDLQ